MDEDIYLALPDEVKTIYDFMKEKSELIAED